MKPRRWLAIFAAVLLTALIGCAAADTNSPPTDTEDPTTDMTTDETQAPSAVELPFLEIEGQQYDAFILGSADAAWYSAAELDSYLDADVYSLFVSGYNTNDYRDLAAHILSRYRARYLVLHLGFGEAAFGGGSTAADLSALRFEANCAVYDPRGEEPDIFSLPNGTDERRMRDIVKVGDPDAYLASHGDAFALPDAPIELPCAADCAANVAAIRELCATSGTELILILSPVYAPLRELCGDAFSDYRAAIAREADCWDFSCTTLSHDSRYFYDAYHFRSAVGTMVLAEIFSDEKLYRPEDFGTYLTSNACEADSAQALSPAPDENSYTINVPILLYHHFSDSGDPENVASAETFESHIRALAEAGYTAVTFEELLNYVLYGAPLPEKPICITMDDGYYSNYEIACPILEKYNMKATVFIIGCSVGHMEYYKDTTYPITPHFSYDVAREMQTSGVMDIQCHSYDLHQWPPYESGEAVRESMLPFPDESEADYAAVLQADIALFQQIRIEELGSPFCALAYPGGRYNDLVELLVHEAGIPVTLSTRTDCRNILVRGLPQSLYALCRRNVAGTTTAEDLLSSLN